MGGEGFDGRLYTHLGSDVAEGLREWQRVQGYEPRVPVEPWRATNGYTEAVLSALLVRRGSSSWKVVLKVCPPRTPEPAAHLRAWEDAPAFARDHLVELPLGSWLTPKKRILLFQAIAGDDDTFATRPLSELPEPGCREVSAFVAGQLLTAWNEGRAGSARQSVASFLLAEIGPEVEAWGSVRSWARGTDLLDERAPWIVLDGEEHPLPNPVLAVAGGGPLAPLEIDVLVGRAHRDLHLENALVPGVGRGQPDAAAFRLVDLATYSSSASLTVDPVMLALSLVARRLPDHTGDERAGLLAVLAAVPGRGPATDDVGASVHRLIIERLGSRRRDWALQWLLSVVARALLFTTFEALPPEERWWFFRLAGRAAATFLHERDPGARPGAAVAVRNPFRERRPSLPRSNGDGRPPLALPRGTLAYETGSERGR